MATSFTLTGPSQGPVGLASSQFGVTPDGVYSGTFTPTGAGCSFTPSSLTWTAETNSKKFRVTKATPGIVAINGTFSPPLTAPVSVDYTAKQTVVRSYVGTGGQPGGAFVTLKNLDGTLWAESRTDVTDLGNGAYSISGVVVPADFSGTVVWDQGAVFDEGPMGPYRAVLDRILDAVKERLEAVDLDGEPRILRIDDLTDVNLPADSVVVTCFQQPQTPVAVVNGRDDYDRGVSVIINHGARGDQSARPRLLLRRERIERAFQAQHDFGVSEVQWCKMRSGQAVLTDAQKIDRVYTAVALTFRTRERRGLVPRGE